MAYIDTIADSGDEMLRLLLLVDFPKGLCVNHLNKRAELAIRETIKHKKLQISADNCYLLYQLPKEKAVELDVRWVRDIFEIKSELKSKSAIILVHRKELSWDR